MTEAEGAVLLFIQEHLRTQLLDPFMTAVTTLGDSGLIWIAAALLLLCFRRYRGCGAAVLLALLIGALVTNVILKNAVVRIRPYEVIEGLCILVDAPHDYSFPSGHSTSSVAAAAVMLRCLPRRFGVPAAVLAALICLSRLYVGVHYPTDVLAGALIGLLAAFASERCLRRFAPPPLRP